MTTPSQEFTDLTASRCRFLCTGPDAARYLNGQLTQDIRLVTSRRALPACLTNAKGKIEAELVVAPAATGFLLDGPASLRDFLALRLEKYLIADDCQFEDFTDSTCQFHLTGAIAISDSHVSDAIPEDAISDTHIHLPDVPDAASYAAFRLGLHGIDVVAPTGGHSRLRVALEAIARPAAPDATDDARIRRGVPLWESELDSGVFPQEAGIEATHVSFQKGCYIGQEVVSRLKSVGQVTRRLRLLQSLDSAARLTVGAEIFASDDPGKPVGVLTSVTSDGQSGLAYIRRPHNLPETRLLALPSGNSALSIPVVVVDTETMSL